MSIFFGILDTDKFFPVRIIHTRLIMKTIKLSCRETVDFYQKLLLEFVFFVSDPVLLFKEDGGIIECNDSACKTFGFSREEFLSLKIQDIGNIDIKDFSTSTHENHGYDVNIFGRGVYILCRKKDGTDLVMESSLHVHKNKNDTVFVLVMKNNKNKNITKSDLSDQLHRVEVIDDISRPLIAMLGARDPYTARHSKKVGEIMHGIGSLLNRSKEECVLLRITGSLHDIGKTAIPVEILSKPGKLADEEMSLIRTHPERGYGILSNSGFYCKHIAKYVLHHHERHDGSGYPYGLSGSGISLGAQIVSVADTFEAMTSQRPYHLPVSSDQAIGYLRKNKGVLYDSTIVEALISYQSSMVG